MEVNQDVLKEVIRRVAEKVMAAEGSSCAETSCDAAPQAPCTCADPIALPGLISERKVTNAFESGHRSIKIAENAIITPSARDYIYSKQIKVIRE